MIMRITYDALFCSRSDFLLLSRDWIELPALFLCWVVDETKYLLLLLFSILIPLSFKSSKKKTKREQLQTYRYTTTLIYVSHFDTGRYNRISSISIIKKNMNSDTR